MKTPPSGPWHCGRSFSDTRLEDICECPKEPCGLVNLNKASPDCQHGHYFLSARTIRQSHTEENCPGGKK